MERVYKYIINDKSGGLARLKLVETTSEAPHDIKTDRGVWSEKETYAPGDQVIHGGSVWVAVEENTASRPALGNTRWQYLGALDRSDMALVVTVYDTVDDGTAEKWSSGAIVRVFSGGHDISDALPTGGWVIRSLTPGLTVTYLNADHRTARLELTGQPDGAYIVQGEYTPLRLSSTATVLRLDIDGIISSHDLAKIEDALRLIGDKDEEAKKRLKEAEDALRKEIEALDRDRPAVWSIEVYDTEHPLSPPLLEDKLEGYRTSVTYAYRVYRSGVDVTGLIAKSPAPLVRWARRNPKGYDDDGLADREWEAAHATDTTVTLTTRQIHFECAVTATADSVSLEEYYKSL